MKYMVLALLGLFTAGPSLGWGELGHQIVADIAWAELDPVVKARVNELIATMGTFYPGTNEIGAASAWADDIRQELPAFVHWHFISTPYMAEKGGKKPQINPENLVWALCQSMHTLAQKGGQKASDNFEKAFMLRFFLHLVADAHQPLHAVTRVTKKMPNGDMGGNLFQIKIDGKKSNLHLYWDLGLGEFGDVNKTQAQNKDLLAQKAKMVTQLKKEFPSSSFGDRVQNINFKEWAKESYNLAVKTVYRLEEKTEPSAEYVKEGRRLVRERIALAGYRLGYLLNQIFSVQGKKLPTGCKI